MYILKFMFDYGANYNCLWTVNEAAMERFGTGSLDINCFPLSSDTKAKIGKLCEEFQTILNWDEPQSGLIWSKEQKEKFRIKAFAVYNQVVAELGDEFEVENWIDHCIGYHTA